MLATFLKISVQIISHAVADTNGVENTVFYKHTYHKFH